MFSRKGFINIFTAFIVVALLAFVLGFLGRTYFFNFEQKSVLGIKSREEVDSDKIIEQYTKKATAYLKDTPNPVEELFMEGTYGNNPRLLASRDSLLDMQKLYELNFIYLQTRQPKFEEKIKEYILAWTRTYKPTGNPINESHLWYLIEGYRYTKGTYSVSESLAIDNWLRNLYNKVLNYPLSDVTSINNWNSQRLSVLTSISLVLNDDQLINESLELVKLQLSENLNPDGTTYDFIDRDSLHYQCYDLDALLYIARDLKLYKDIDLYTYVTENGGSLQNSFEYIYPYVSGEKTHKEFVNTKAEYDKKKSLDGALQLGQDFSPESCRRTLDIGNYFDQSTLKYLRSIYKSDSLYPSIAVLMNKYVKSPLYAF